MFRLWILGTLAWILGAGFALRYDIGRDCDHLILSTTNLNLDDSQFLCKAIRGDFDTSETRLTPEERQDLGYKERAWITTEQWVAIGWWFCPPVALLLIGTAVYWAVSGFKRKKLKHTATQPRRPAPVNL